MEIVVCVKWSPETCEADLAVARDSRDIVKEGLDYDINEWDRFAIEEAVQIKEKMSGKVTVVSVASEDAEEMLRECLARGADEAFRLWDDSFSGSDGYVVARILAAFIKARPCDLILTGTLADDDCGGQVGGMLAAMLDIPSSTLVSEIEVRNGTVSFNRELEGGLYEALEMDLPALISVATGLNELRFVSIRAVKRVASAEIPSLGLADLGIDAAKVGPAGSGVLIENVSLPPVGEGAEMITGSVEEIASRLAEVLKERGGIK